MTKVLVNPNYLLNVAFRDYKRYDSNEGELDTINGDTYKVLVSMLDIRNCKHSIERITGYLQSVVGFVQSYYEKQIHESVQSTDISGP